MRSRIMYIEDKADLIGDARIGRVTFSRSGRTLHYGGREYQSLKGLGFKSNFHDVETGEEYWTEIRRAPERAAEAIANAPEKRRNRDEVMRRSDAVAAYALRR